MERTKEYSVVNDTLKALKNQGLLERYFQKGHSFSSAPRYDHFDTSPDYMSCGCRSGIHSFIIISELRVNENPQNENFNHSPLSVQSMSVSFSPSRHFRDTHRMW